MRIRSLFTAVLGLGLAGGSIFVAKEILLDPNGAAVASQPATVDVIVARAPITFGQPIEAHLLKTQAWPAKSIPAGSFSNFAGLLSNDSSEIRRAKSPFYEGEVILASKLSAPGEKVTIVQKLGENSRAVSIKVDAVTAVGGFVTPGDFVDILLTQGKGDEMRTVTILQNIRVIGVDQSSEENTDAPEVARTVTVEVTPEGGQKLALAQKAGTLNLTLRTLDNVVDAPLQMIDLRDLLQKESPIEDVAKIRTIRVRRGNEAEEVEIR